MRIGLTELIVICILAIAFFKPEKLPQYAEKLGKVFSRLQESKEQVQQVIKPAQEFTQPVTELKNDVNSAITNITNLDATSEGGE